MLEAAGLSALQERAYTALVARSPMTITQLAEELALSAGEAATVAAALEHLKLIARTPGEHPLLIASPPQVAVEALLARREEDLRQARAGLAELVTAYRFGGRLRAPGELIEIVHGRSAIQHCFAQIQRAARHEMLVLVAPPFALPTGNNTDEFDVLQRGVRARAVYERSVLEVVGSAQEIARYMAAGEEARAVDQVPAKYVVADRQTALIPMEAGQPGIEPGAILVQASALVEVMVSLFENVWASATPLRLGPDNTVHREGPNTTPLSDEDTRIIALLLSGLSDKNVASQLGISLRTVQRRIHHLMTLTGVHTRMQLGWHCARHGWI